MLRHLCEFTGLDFEMAIYEHYYEALEVGVRPHFTLSMPDCSSSSNCFLSVVCAKQLFLCMYLLQPLAPLSTGYEQHVPLYLRRHRWAIPARAQAHCPTVPLRTDQSPETNVASHLPGGDTNAECEMIWDVVKVVYPLWREPWNATFLIFFVNMNLPSLSIHPMVIHPSSVFVNIILIVLEYYYTLSS